jgi:hypothetical protein
MIKSTGTFKLNESDYTQYTGEIYFYFIPILSQIGYIHVDVVMYTDLTLTTEISRYKQSPYVKEIVSGGVGDTEYDKIIDKLEDLTIDHLSSFNTDVVFEKVSIPQTNPVNEEPPNDDVVDVPIIPEE